jgi:hypothetical protein
VIANIMGVSVRCKAFARPSFRDVERERVEREATREGGAIVTSRECMCACVCVCICMCAFVGALHFNHVLICLCCCCCCFYVVKLTATVGERRKVLTKTKTQKKGEVGL